MNEFTNTQMNDWKFVQWNSTREWQERSTWCLPQAILWDCFSVGTVFPDLWDSQIPMEDFAVGYLPNAFLLVLYMRTFQTEVLPAGYHRDLNAGG